MVLLNVVGAGHDAAHGQLAVAHLGPLVGEGQGLPHAGVLDHQGGGGGDGEHADAVLRGRHLGGDLLGGHPLDVHAGRVHPVLGEQVVEDVLGVGPLAGGVDRLARQVGHGGHGVPLLQNIEDAQGVHRQHLNGLRVLVHQIGGHVGGHGGDVRVPVDEGGGHYLVIRLHHGGGQHLVLLGGGLVVGHQLGGPHAGGAGEHHEVGQLIGLRHRDVPRAGGGLGAGGAGAGAAAAAGQGGDHQGPAQEQRELFSEFHLNLPFQCIAVKNGEWDKGMPLIEKAPVDGISPGASRLSFVHKGAFGGGKPPPYMVRCP